MIAAALVGMLSLCLAQESDLVGNDQEADALPATVVPVPSTETRAAAAGWKDGRGWSKQHEDCVALARGQRHDLILLGDSITQSFGGDGRRTWQPARATLDSCFEGMRIANMGISGDRTQHLLWRLQNGALSGEAPGAYVIAIGTNNIERDDPAAIAAGIEKIVQLLRERRQESVLLLCPILPRGFTPEDPARRAVDEVNRRIRPLAVLDRVWWVDPQQGLLQDDGGLRTDCYGADGLHLAGPGYKAWGAAIGRALEKARVVDAEGEPLE